MKKAFITLAVILFITPFIKAQNPASEKPFIDVTGIAEMEVVPDMIYIKFILSERNSGKSKVSIQEQEDSLKSALKSVNINLENLFLNDASSQYVKVYWKKDDVLTSKGYTLLVNSAKDIGKVFFELDKLKIDNAFIAKVDHTKIKEYRKEVRIDAIKAAKEKANYLLNAIGNQTGTPLIVRENSIRDKQIQLANTNIRGSRSEAQYTYVNGVKVKSAENQIQFEKIKIVYSVFVKFEIK